MQKNKVKMIGPNTPGIIVPEIMKVGIMPAQPFTTGVLWFFQEVEHSCMKYHFTLSNQDMVKGFVWVLGVTL